MKELVAVVAGLLVMIVEFTWPMLVFLVFVGMFKLIEWVGSL